MFDFNKIEDFDKHISLSIPNYDMLSAQIITYADYFLEWGYNVYDLGCSTGRHLKLMAKKDGIDYIGYDSSNLIPKDTEYCKFIKADLHDIKLGPSSLVLSIFTLQFLHEKTREKILDEVMKSLKPGGALIVAEKTFSCDSKIQSIMDSAHREYKSQHFKPAEIFKKEIELRDNMRPKRYHDLVRELSEIGTVQEIWRSFNFVAFIVLKSDGIK